MSWQYKFANNLLDSLDLAEAAKHSFKNYHAEGLDYLCLQRTQELTVKLYVTRPDDLRHNAQGYLVHPHTHRYPFHTFVLIGGMANIVFTPSNKGKEWNEHSFEKAIEGTILKFEKKIKLAGEATYIGQGESYYMDESQIHSIRLSAVQPVVLMLFQYQNRKAKNSLFSPLPLIALRSEGLYKPMSTEDIIGVVQKVRSLI